MQQNLPLEMDFRQFPFRFPSSISRFLTNARSMTVGHEAANAARCVNDFSQLKQTSVVVPEVLWAKRRVMAMECELTFSLHLYAFMS